MAFYFIPIFNVFASTLDGAEQDNGRESGGGPDDRQKQRTNEKKNRRN